MYKIVWDEEEKLWKGYLLNGKTHIFVCSSPEKYVRVDLMYGGDPEGKRAFKKFVLDKGEYEYYFEEELDGYEQVKRELSSFDRRKGV